MKEPYNATLNADPPTSWANLSFFISLTDIVAFRFAP